MIDQHHFTSKHSSPLFSSPLVYFLTFCLFCHFCLLCFSFPFHLLSSYFFLLKQVISSKPSFSIRIDKNKDKSFPKLARKCPEQLSCQYPYNRALVITSITLNSSKMIKDTITRRGKNHTMVIDRFSTTVLSKTNTRTRQTKRPKQTCLVRYFYTLHLKMS